MRAVPCWDKYFLNIAEAVAARSKDPRTQVGAVIVSPDNRILGTGYNGMVPGEAENDKTWSPEHKYVRVIHAEMNAILHATKEVRGATLYVTLTPCPECSKLIKAAGIARVVVKPSE